MGERSTVSPGFAALAALLTADYPFHPLAKLGFWAMVALMVVHATILLGHSSGRAAAPTATSTGSVPPATSAPSSPARWADDPFGRQRLRYWDGGRWTEHVSDGEGAVIDQPLPSVPTMAVPRQFQPASFDFTPPQPGLASPPAFRADHDGRTVSRAELEAMRGRAPVPSSYVLVFDDGGRVPMETAVIIGRDPAVSLASAGAMALRLEDPTMSVSKTHLAIGVTSGNVWVEDLGSVNGTSIVTVGGFETDVSAGQRLPVAVGSTVKFGERWCTVDR